MIVKTLEQLKKCVDFLSDSEVLSFDTETTDLKYMGLELVGISFYGDRDEAEETDGWYVAIGETLSTTDVCGAVAPLLQSHKNLKVAHNMKYDMMVMKKYGVQVEPPFADTLIMGHLLDENRSNGLKALADSVLKKNSIESFVEVVPKGMSIWDVDADKIGKYAINDAKWTYELHKKFKDEILIEKQEVVYNRVELPLVPVLVDMQIRGIALDREYLAGMEFRVELELDLLEKRIYKEVGHPFNLTSPQQVGKVLFEEMKIPVLEKTATGRYSTSAWVLQQLANKGYDFVKQLLRHRKLAKMLNTYVVGLPKNMDSDGRVRCSFNSTGTVTGRLSSNNPNLQNQPTDSEWRLRGAFVAEKDKTFIVADYSQIELRIIAHLSQDPEMIRMFNEGGDIHQQTADELKISRKEAKGANFAYAYGAWGEYKERYFEHFPYIKKWHKKTEKFLNKFGFIRTMTGRKRRIGITKGKPWNEINRMYRTSYNSTIQGSAADLMKLSMIAVNKRLPKYGAEMLLTVHDEIIIEVPISKAEACKKVVYEEMLGCMKLDVPLEVDIKIANNWADGK